ncbi:MAG: gliding motility-associated C-terminal domain-containing protein [Chryseolinea sp.]
MSTISDSLGNLLFYSTGVDAWDRLHFPMPNGYGLHGHTSSTQSALIVPKPANPDLYYLFTTDAGSYIDDDIRGLNYSTVSLCENSGFGDVLLQGKNTNLARSTAEKVSAVHHANGTDTWVLTHPLDSDEFYAYLVTEDGINPGAIKSKVGFYYTNSNDINTLGQMKFTSGGEKLAMAVRGEGIIQVFDFNNETGILSNGITLRRPSAYGLEFSADGSKLYVTHNDNSRLTQFDLSLNTVEEIQHSAILISSVTPGGAGALQLGMDGKIYTNLLHVINDPNNTGLSCGYEARNFEFSSGGPQIGLNDFVQSFVDQKPYIIYSKQCDNQQVDFRLAHEELVQSVSWTFNDVNSNFNESSKLRPGHIFGRDAIFNVQAIITLKSGDVLLKDKKVVWNSFTVSLGPDTTLCDISNYILTAPYLETTCYEWQDGSTLPNFNAKRTDWYWVDVRFAGCVQRDSIYVQFEETPKIKLEVERILCEGEFIQLDLSDIASEYLWSDSSVLPTLLVRQPGLLWVKAANGLCMRRDTMFVILQPKISLNLPLDTILCEDKSIQLIANQFFDTIHWSTGSNDSEIEVSAPGLYWIVAERNSCITTDSIYVHGISNFDQTSVDTLFCSDTEIVLNVERAFSDYQWSTGDKESTLKVLTTGHYYVNIQNYCYERRIDFNVHIVDCNCNLFIPNIFTPNGDGKNDVFSPLTHQNISELNFQIFNRWGGKAFHTTDAIREWDGFVEGVEASPGVYYYQLNYKCLQNSIQNVLKKAGSIHLKR